VDGGSAEPTAVWRPQLHLSAEFLEPVFKSCTMGFLTRRDQRNLSGIDGSGDPSYIKRRLGFDLKTGS